ncbi:Gfo/Idh/MocA family oxidoreductase [bacterium]|nr:Gfo/Idh/MocA family oxidoreductase [bacterium]
MASEIKTGIIGCGQVSRVGHGPAIDSDERACITAIADPDDENRAKFKRMFRVPAAYPDHRTMLEKEELDAVVIASPPWLHRDQLRDAISAGTHILCEKPIATTLEDCRAMVEMAESHPRVVQAGHSKRFETGFQRIKELIDSGMMGDIYQMSIYWHYYIPDLESRWLKRILDFSKKHWIDFEKRYGAWRYFDPRAGGGDFFDHAPHYIDLMRFLLADIESIYCQTRRFIENRLHEDLAVAIFTLANNAVAVMEKSTLVMGRPAGFETGSIYAERAKMAFEAFQEYKHKKMKVRLYTPVNILPDRYRNLRLPGGRKDTLYYRQMRHFIDRIVGEKTVIENYDGEWSASIEDASTAVAWTLAGYRSAKEGRAIGKGEIFGKT